jgi:hypothetical protein
MSLSPPLLRVLSQVEKEPYCARPFFMVRITCDGNVWVCCWQRLVPIGNLLERDFDAIWWGDEVASVRAAISRGQMHETCARVALDCPYAYEPLHPSSREAPLPYPNYIELDLPNYHCNIGGPRPTEKNPACLMCERSAGDYPFDKVDHFPTLLPKLRHLVPHLHRIHVQGVAEALWHNYFFRVLDLIDFDRYRDSLCASTCTNGIAFNAKRRQELIRRVPRASISFSIDAASAGVYRQIRRLDAYDLVIANLMAYAREKPPESVLRIQNNLNRLNIHEAIGMVRTAAEARVSEIEFNPTGGFRTEIVVNEEWAATFKATQELITAEAKRLGVKVIFTRPLDLGLTAQADARSPCSTPPPSADAAIPA